jgi:hypothetical protein
MQSFENAVSPSDGDTPSRLCRRSTYRPFNRRVS